MLQLSHEGRYLLEATHRREQAWAAYNRHRKLLLNHHVPLKLRLQHFDSVVTPCALYGICAMPLGVAQQNLLWSCQRKMLRSIVGWRRLPDEPWEETMRRMKARLERVMLRFLVEPWERQWRRSLWRYDVHLAKSPPDSWAHTVDEFCPSKARPRRRSCLRWHDPLRKFCLSRFGSDKSLEIVLQHLDLEDEFAAQAT